MINYFVIASFGYALLAVVAILDKAILTKSLRVPTYTFYSTIFLWGAFLLLPFAEPITVNAFIWALVSGLAFGFATWAMFLGLRRGEAAHIVPFIGASTAVFVFGLSSVIIHESFTKIQALGIVLLIIASLLFSYEKNRRYKGTHRDFAWGLIAGFLFALSHVAAKHFYGEYSFITGLVWTKGLVGIVALITLFSASTWKDIFGKKDVEKQVSENTMWVVVADKVIGLIGTVAIQYAIAIGSVAIVSGLVGLQYALILIFAFVSTVLAPKFFKEYFTKKEVIVEVTAIMVVVMGITLLI